MDQHQLYMNRCLELARQGAGFVAPNPMVGAVLVFDNRIMGEGYHEKYGEAHAEVNCINSVKEADKPLIAKATLYVSLEPCGHFGRTPPCTDMIIEHKIPNVVVGCTDISDAVNGKGIDLLKDAGIAVTVGVLESECKELNKRFFTFHTLKRPYVILKWAQSKNQKIANADFSRVWITNVYSNRLIHRWRSEEAAIMVGTNTALQDDPALNTRHWTGPDPVRLIVDMNLRLPDTLQLFDKKQRTVVFNGIKNEENENLIFCKIEKEPSLVKNILKACYELNIQSVIIEGGNKLAESFINEHAWDEARVIENSRMIIDNGLRAPVLSNQKFMAAESVFTDVISYYKNTAQQ